MPKLSQSIIKSVTKDLGLLSYRVDLPESKLTIYFISDAGFISAQETLKAIVKNDLRNRGIEIGEITNQQVIEFQHLLTTRFKGVNFTTHLEVIN